jgi:hypothetical protein
MSALGQKQTCAAHKVMSALHPKADMCGATRDVRYGPKADTDAITGSLRYAGEQRWQNFKHLSKYDYHPDHNCDYQHAGQRGC